VPVNFQSMFVHPLLDLGAAEDPAFRGVLSPQPEVGSKREGVNDAFLGQAEDYYKKYQGFDYWRSLISAAAQRVGASDPRLVVEFGCGFGNSTLPMLDLFPNASIVATDISPNLLSILHRLLESRGLTDRCIAVAMDAHKPYIVPGIADFVLGSAILHHLSEPGEFVAEAMQVLKPGGSAVFFEPFEAGLAILRLACQEVVAESGRRGWRSGGPVVKFAGNIAKMLEPQILRRVRNWRDLDDKWAFPRSVLQDIADATNTELIVYPLHDNKGQFRRHFTYMLEAYGGLKREDVPSWAWEPFDRFDNETFSPAMLTDLPIEGCVIFRKKGS
jgi:SAM-dependent methyltransferase